MLAGPPNVGKSSLINALLGFQRAIVFDQPGTTRDVLTTRTAIDGWPVVLADTAGLRLATDDVEGQGITRAWEALRGADCVVAVMEVGQDRAWPAAAFAEDALHVLNKVDVVADRSTLPQGPILTSAVTGLGLDELLAAISQQLVPQPPPAGGAVIFTARQRARLEQALAACQRPDGVALRASLAQLTSLSGSWGCCSGWVSDWVGFAVFPHNSCYVGFAADPITRTDAMPPS